MTKYKILGFFSIIISLPYVFWAIQSIVFTLPRMSSLYSELGINNMNYYIMRAYLFTGLAALLGIIDIFFGIKLFGKSEVQIKFYKPSLIFAIISFAGLTLIISLITASTILPFYNITSSF